jgi:uncharacterized protein YggE
MRGRVGIVAAIVAAGMCAAAPAGAQAHDGPTKDSPKLVHVQGTAERDVPVDGVRLLFSYATERGTFGQAGEDGQAIVAAIRKSVGDLDGPTLTVHYGWDLLRQAKISLSTKGRRIDHSLALELEGVAPGQLHNLVSHVIDRSLEASDKLELEQIEVYLTDAKEQEVRTALFADAAKQALTHAQAMVGATGAQIAGPRYLYSTDQMVPFAQADSAREMMMTAGPIAVRKSFNVRAEVADHLTVGVTVLGAFEIP